MNLLLALAMLSMSDSTQAPCPRCDWTAPEIGRRVVRVADVASLEAAVDRLEPGTTILLANGRYPLRRWLPIQQPDVVIRGQSQDRSQVQLIGPGVDERQVGVALSVAAPRVTIADLTISRVGYHAIQVRGELGADAVSIHNVHLIDTGQQLIKGSMGGDGRGPHRGRVACSTLEYTDHAPSDYTNGVDVLGGDEWTVRSCVFLRIRGPESNGWRAGPAILFWKEATNTVIEGNLIIGCYRGIALGLNPRPESSDGADHRGGVIRRNIIWTRDTWADESIEVNACPNVLIEHNSILTAGQLPWAIKVRFPQTTAEVRNNLANRPIVVRDGATAVQNANLNDARAEWFRDAKRGDLHLAGPDLPPIDAGVPANRDDSSTSGKAPDIGAYEYTDSPTRRPE